MLELFVFAYIHSQTTVSLTTVVPIDIIISKYTSKLHVLKVKCHISSTKKMKKQMYTIPSYAL